MTRLRRLFVFFFIVNVVLFAQASAPLLTGRAAASRFVYQGRAINGDCVDFGILLGENKPHALAQCSSRAAIRASAKHAADSVNGPQSYVHYYVLASRGSRFLLSVDAWGGGTGEFSAIYWVRLDKGNVLLDHDLGVGGDRCNGSIFDAKMRDGKLYFSASITSLDLALAADVFKTKQYETDLNSCPICCHGLQNQVYDPTSDKIDTLSYRVDRLDKRERYIDESVQDCLEQFADAQLAPGAPSLELSPDQLRDFGRRFTLQCLANAPVAPSVDPAPPAPAEH